jgi:hypothetical protein
MKKLAAKVLFSLPLIILLAGCDKTELNKPPVANAGNPLTTQLPADSVTLTGAGSDEDGQISAYLWSQIKGPNSSNIVNPGSPSTKVQGLIAGSYLFQLMVVDNDGATGVDTVSVMVSPSPIKTLSLQPSNNPTEVHIWGNATNLEGSYNGAPEVGATVWTYNGITVFQRGLFKFDLTSIPSSATIISAKLSLYSTPTPFNGDLVHANSGPDNSMLIQRVVSPWIASSVKWNNQPGTTTVGQITIPHTSQSFLDLIDVNVTDLVKAMVNNNSNYGFMIRLQTEAIYNSRIFASSFYYDASKHPKIVIQYQ